MIVKKLFFKTKCEFYDKEKKKFNFVITTYYIGWFLFGRIPLYIVEIDKEVDNRIDDEPKTYQHKSYEKYGHLLRKES